MVSKTKNAKADVAKEKPKAGKGLCPNCNYGAADSPCKNCGYVKPKAK